MLIFSYSTNKYQYGKQKRNYIFFYKERFLCLLWIYIRESVKFKRELFGTKFEIPLLYIVISKRNNKSF